MCTCCYGLPKPCMITTFLTCSLILRASPCVQSQLQQLIWQLQGHLGVQRACRWVPEAPPGYGQRSRCAGGTLYHHCTVVCGTCMPEKITMRWCQMTQQKGSKLSKQSDQVANAQVTVRQAKISVSPGWVKPVLKHIVCVGAVVATYTCAFLHI